MTPTVRRREDRRRQQDQWLACSEKGLKSRDIALALGESVRTIQWGISAARRRRDRTPQLPKLRPRFGCGYWVPKKEQPKIEHGQAQCRHCGSTLDRKLEPRVSTVTSSSMVCPACHAVSPANQKRINAALNRQDVSDTSRAINYRQTEPERPRKKKAVRA